MVICLADTTIIAIQESNSSMKAADASSHSALAPFSRSAEPWQVVHRFNLIIFAAKLPHKCATFTTMILPCCNFRCTSKTTVWSFLWLSDPQTLPRVLLWRRVLTVRREHSFDTQSGELPLFDNGNYYTAGS